MKKIAVIGLGDIAPIHINAIKSSSEIFLGAVCDKDGGKQSAYPEVPFYADYSEMMEKEKPDCVHLCLPHYLHYAVAHEAVMRGIHVFCEKPMAIDKKEAIAFVELEKANPQVRIGICLQNRRNKTTEQLKKLIDSGEYGRLTGIRGFVPWKRTKEYYEDKPWRGKWKEAGSGVMLNQSVHTLDLLYYLGGEIKELKAMAGQLLDYDIEVEDTAAARLTFRNGASGLFFATNGNYKNDSVSIQAELEHGEFLIRNNSLYQINQDQDWELLAEDQKLPGTKFYYGASHSTIIREFYDSMEKSDQDYIHVIDAWMSMALVDAIFCSSKTGSIVPVDGGEGFKQ
ncbi:Gfo/Idh/MocA family oxidoreductase [Lachnospiraceae bacterium 54-53]